MCFIVLDTFWPNFNGSWPWFFDYILLTLTLSTFAKIDPNKPKYSDIYYSYISLIDFFYNIVVIFLTQIASELIFLCLFLLLFQTLKIKRRDERADIYFLQRLMTYLVTRLSQKYRA